MSLDNYMQELIDEETRDTREKIHEILQGKTIAHGLKSMILSALDEMLALGEIHGGLDDLQSMLKTKEMDEVAESYMNISGDLIEKHGNPVTLICVLLHAGSLVPDDLVFKQGED